MVIRFILFLLVAAIVLRFVMRYVLPVFQMSKMAHRQITDMKKKMEDMHRQQSTFEEEQSRKQHKKIDEEYIEEIK